MGNTVVKVPVKISTESTKVEVTVEVSVDDFIQALQRMETAPRMNVIAHIFNEYVIDDTKNLTGDQLTIIEKWLREKSAVITVAKNKHYGKG